MPLQEFLPANVFAAILVFARLGAAMMLLPGFGEIYVPQRYRLLLGLMMALLLTPVVGPTLPTLPSSAAALVLMLLGEIAVGVFIGTLARMLVAALETAGMIVSLQMGLSAATMFNPLSAEQSSPLPAALYGLLGVVLIFLADLDHLMLRAAVDSYALFTPGKLPPIGDFSEMVTRFAAGSFRLAFELSAPFIVLGIVFFAALGLISRLVPQLQILFIAQPAQVLGGLLLFSVVLVGGMRLFLEAFAQQLGFLAPG